MGDAVGDVAGYVHGAVTHHVNKALNATDAIGDHISNAADAVGDAAGDVHDAVSHHVGQALDTPIRDFFPGSGNLNVSNASNVPESASNLTDIGDFDGDSENMTEGSHSDATHASHLINHVANSTNATNASAAQPPMSQPTPNKPSSPSVAGDGARGPDTTTDSSANDTKIWAD